MWIIAAVACAALMVACGGEKKSDVEAEATKRATKAIEALKSGDQAAYEKLCKENEAWSNTLSEADQEKAAAIAEKLAKEAGLL